MMKTTIKEKAGNYLIRFEGRLDTAAAPQVGKELQQLSYGEGDITFECSELEYISSSGLRLLLGVLKKAKAVGGHVYIKGLNDNIRTVFAMTGFVNLFEYK